MSANAQFESMTRLVIGRHTIRVWRTEESSERAFMAENRDLKEWAQGVIRSFILAPTKDERDELEPCAYQLYTELAEFPRISAIEILDESLNGFVCYSDWP